MTKTEGIARVQEYIDELRQEGFCDDGDAFFQRLRLTIGRLEEESARIKDVFADDE